MKLNVVTVVVTVFGSVLAERHVVDDKQTVSYLRPLLLEQPGTLRLCDVTKDCNHDSDCETGLVCADEHKELLQSLGYDGRGANCEKMNDDKPWKYDVCFDPTTLDSKNTTNETILAFSQHHGSGNDGLDTTTMTLMDDTTTRSLSTFDTRFCVYNASSLISATKRAISNGPNYSRIDVCVSNIKLWQPLNVTNKRIELTCKVKRCIIDGSSKSRFMIGKNSNIVMNGIEFVNGYSTLGYTKSGGIGAFYFTDSTIVMRNMQFRGNNFTKGAIIYSDVSSPTTNKKKSNITLANITFEKNIAYDALFFANSKVNLNKIIIRNNPNSSAITAVSNTDLTMVSSSIKYNNGLDYFNMFFKESRIVFNYVTIENNVASKLLYAERSIISLSKSLIKKNMADDDPDDDADGYPFGTLHFAECSVNMNSISILNNTQLGQYQSTLEFVSSNVSMINTNVKYNFAQDGPNMYVTDTNLVMTNVSFFYNEANAFLPHSGTSRTMNLTNSYIMMYKTKFYKNSNLWAMISPYPPYGVLVFGGEFIRTDTSTRLLCDKKTLLCYDGNLSDEDIQGNCTFSDQSSQCQ